MNVNDVVTIPRLANDLPCSLTLSVLALGVGLCWLALVATVQLRKPGPGAALARFAAMLVFFTGACALVWGGYWVQM